MQGKTEYKPRKMVGTVRLMVLWNGKLAKVVNSEIPDYVDDELWSAVNLWNRYKAYGLPFGGGWAEQPAHLVDAIDAVEHGIREYNSRHGS